MKLPEKKYFKIIDIKCNSFEFKLELNNYAITAIVCFLILFYIFYNI